MGKIFLPRNLIDNPKYCENENNSRENFNLRKYKEHLKLLKRKHKLALSRRNVLMHPYNKLKEKYEEYGYNSKFRNALR